MLRQVNLLDYLPPFVQEYKEIKELADSMTVEIQSAIDASEKLKNNLFIYTTNEDGIKRFESLVGIVPLDTDTLSDRQFKVVSKWNMAVPYTFRSLQERLETLCGGSDMVTVEMVSNFEIKIKVALGGKNKLESTRDMVKTMLPCNIAYEVILMYNTHGVLSAYTHETLSQFTYQELRDSNI